MRGRISIIFGMSVWRNDIKYKYMFMFPLKNLARKEMRFWRISYIATVHGV